MAGPPELILAGRIATLAGGPGLGWAEAIAVGEGRVVAAGRRHEVLPLAGRGTRVHSLPPGLVVLPGITDAHLHLLSAAAASLQLDLGMEPDRAGVLGAIARAHRGRVGAGDRDGWLLGHGWSLDRMGGWPTADDLDAVAPGRAVALWAHDHHARWVSHAALAAAGIELMADPAGGRIGRDPAGAPGGLLHEDAATLVDRAIPALSDDALAGALRDMTGVLLALGVTAVHDPGEMTPDPTMARVPGIYRRLALEGALGLRVAASVREEQLDAAIGVGFRTGLGVPDAVSSRHRDSTLARYHDGWLKLFADGSLGSRSAALLEPYEPDDPAGRPVGGPRGMRLRERPDLERLARRATAAGIAVQIHAIGDGAVHDALDVLDALPRVGRAMHRVEHAQLIDGRDVPRFARAGIAASMQPCHLAGDAAPARQAWGRRSARCFPLAELVASGATTPLGTDAPVEPPDPWRTIALAVTRRSADWGPDAPPFHPEQAVSLEQAIRAACLDGPRSLGLADLGHLGIGARADMVIVEAAAIDEPPLAGGALESCRPLATLIDGTCVAGAIDMVG